MSRIPKIGELLLNNPPYIVGIVDRIYPLEDLFLQVSTIADLIEFRADLIEGPFSNTIDYLKRIRQQSNIPIIGTLRPNSTNFSDRLDQFDLLLPFVDAVDIEFDLPSCHDLMQKVTRCHLPIVLSIHGFDATPDVPTLAHTITSMMALHPAILKLAFYAHTVEDESHLLETLRRECSIPWVGIAMGENGLRSRIEGHRWGSLWTYGFLSHSVAPGQFSIASLKTEIQRTQKDLNASNN